MLVSFTIPLALSTGASTVVGNFLGEGNPQKARSAAGSGFILNCCMNSPCTVNLLGFLVVNSTLLMSLRNYYGRMYTNDEAVLALAPKVLMFSACATVLYLFYMADFS